MLDPMDYSMIETYKKEAEELGITLQEYLSYLILNVLHDLTVTAYIEE